MRPPSSRFTGRVCVRCARERKGVFLERRGARVARSPVCTNDAVPRAATIALTWRGASRAPRRVPFPATRRARHRRGSSRARIRVARYTRPSKKTFAASRRRSSRGVPRPHPKRDGNGSLQENSGRPRAFEFAREWYTRQYTADPCASAAESTFRRRGLERALSDGPTRVSFPERRPISTPAESSAESSTSPSSSPPARRLAAATLAAAPASKALFASLPNLVSTENALGSASVSADGRVATEGSSTEAPPPSRRPARRGPSRTPRGGDRRRGVRVPRACLSRRLLPATHPRANGSCRRRRRRRRARTPCRRHPGTRHPGSGTRARRGAPERRRRRSGAAPWRSRRDAGPRRRARTRRARRSRSARPATGASTRCWRVSARPA